MILDRREFLAMTAAAAGATLLGGSPARAARPGPGTYFNWQTAGDEAWMGADEGGNTLVVLARDGAILVDCKNAPFGASLRREAQALGKPLRQVINTHHHLDHTGGNHAFTPDLPVLAHANCKVRVAMQLKRYVEQVREATTRLKAVNRLPEIKRPDKDKVLKDVLAYEAKLASLKPPDFEPTQVMSSDQQDLEIAGEKIALKHFGPGHTDNDVVVHVPARNLVHCGDLLFNNRHPYIDRGAGATTHGWQESLRKIIALCDARTVVIPGHGDVTDVNGLKTQLDYFDRVRDLVAKARQDGKNNADTQRLAPDAFQGYTGGNWQAVLAAVFEELEEAGAK